MTARILDGKAFANSWREALKQRVAQLQANHQCTPGLAVILVGNDPASEVYVGHKEKACAQVGIHSKKILLDAGITQAELTDTITQLNEDPSIHGILVQLPLPHSINQQTIIETIAPHKDVDGFHPYNLGRLAARMPALRPCTPYGIMRLLDHHQLDVRGLNATVVGASNIVGRPMSLELLLAGATVTTCHRFTKDLKDPVSNAELLVVATGIMDLIDPSWVREGSIVIDVGIHRLDDGTLRGDLNFAAAAERAGWITPVPGGVGPMTVTALMENTVTACANACQ